MFGVRREVRLAAAAALALMMAVPAVGQVSTRRRETSATRAARIAATMQSEYGHTWEVGGGGGYLRFRSGEYLQKNNEVSWQAGATYYRSPGLGYAADILGSFGNAKVPNNIFNEAYRPLINEYTFLVGPNWRFYRALKWTASLKAQGGVSLGNFDGGAKGLRSEDLGLWQSAMRPAFSASMNLDYNIYPNLLFRVAPTYVGTVFQLAPSDPEPQPHGGIQNNAGINFGFYYRFGTRK